MLIVRTYDLINAIIIIIITIIIIIIIVIICSSLIEVGRVRRAMSAIRLLDATKASVWEHLAGSGESAPGAWLGCRRAVL